MSHSGMTTRSAAAKVVAEDLGYGAPPGGYGGAHGGYGFGSGYGGYRGYGGGGYAGPPGGYGKSPGCDDMDVASPANAGGIVTAKEKETMVAAIRSLREALWESKKTVSAMAEEIQNLKVQLGKQGPPAPDAAPQDEMASMRAMMEELKADYAASLAQLREKDKRERAEVQKMVDGLAAMQQEISMLRATAASQQRATPDAYTSFKLILRKKLKTSGAKLAMQASKLIAEHLKVHVWVTEAFYLKTADGKQPRLLVKISSAAQAAIITRNRKALKGNKDLQILDELTKEEMVQHAALWPQFTAARAAGKAAWFIRARLYVEGAEVAPVGPSA